MATPLLFVLAEYFFPLNLKVIFLPLRYLPFTLLNVAFIITFLEDFLIFTGGMSVDPDDLTPGAVKKLGAEIISYGVPSQPGNMTLVAYLNDIPVLGVPGAAISLPTTMFDVLLPQIYAGIRFTKQDLIRLGDGGLCQMCKECHYPNCTFGRY